MSGSDFYLASRKARQHPAVRGRPNMLAMLTILEDWARFEDSTGPDKRHPETQVAKGQLAASLSELGDEAGISAVMVYRALLRLEVAGLIKREVHKRFTVVTVPIPADETVAEFEWAMPDANAGIDRAEAATL